jgi:hypothetical protein
MQPREGMVFDWCLLQTFEPYKHMTPLGSGMKIGLFVEKIIKATIDPIGVTYL